MKNKKLIKNTALYSLGEILPRALSFILLPIYTRYLSPGDYGITSYTHTIILFLYVLGAFGLNTFVLRYYFIYEEEEKQKTLIGTAFLSIALINIVIIVGAFIIMPEIIEKYSIQVPWNPYFKLAFIINFFDCLSIIPSVVYRVRQDAMKFVALSFSRTLLTVLLTVYCLSIKNLGVLGVFQAQLYIVIPYAFIYLFIINKYARWKIDFDCLKEGLKFAFPLVPGSICYILLSMSDRVVLERNVGISELGIYNVACQMALVLNIVIQSGYKAIEPELFRRFGNDSFYDFIGKIKSIFFCAIYIGALLLCLFSQEVFFLMTSEAFHEGYLLVPALMVGVVMTGQNVIYGGVLQGERRTKVNGGATIMGALISIIMNLILIPLFGTYAAAVSSAVSFFVMNTILFVSMTYPGKSMWRELVLVLIIPFVSYLVFSLFREISMVNLLVKILLTSLYALVAIRLLGIDVNDVKVIIKNKQIV